MDLYKALRILDIVKCDKLGYARDLSYTPSAQEIGAAISLIEEFVLSMEDSVKKFNSSLEYFR